MRRGRQRFIPAHAGNTSRSLRASGAPAVHPRTRGEHGAGRLPRRSGHGSSPHTRGTLGVGVAVGLVDRFIPAHAGNTACEAARASERAVHPRTRGEHSFDSIELRINSGSSPHTRGTLRLRFPPSGSIRFIPAHAGNTSSPPLPPRGSSVHPRTRGEHLEWRDNGVRYDGSSPHTRGTLRSRHGKRCWRRFIPAHAGNTFCARFCPRFSAVHPRTRGEHACIQVVCNSRVRFIPAHAGNTSATPIGAICPAVHPRTRGEHSSCNMLIRDTFSNCKRSTDGSHS